ncbi:MAG: preprotein translocase subunit SecA [Candidatus Kerfeldbacteria bacterium RIFOXYA2_FULL_38_24]|nr:MAG: preprotein translocase subunit SecA [Candidatus Kerfeldbacteria bacterium RIFOXYA2_FULL_38_24]
MNKYIQKLFGDPNKKALKDIQNQIDQINGFEEKIQKLTDQQLREKTVEFRNRLKDKEKIDDILPEAFALVREAALRTLGQRHYDVQLIGGAVLHQGNIAEMKTGEGKTLAATTAAYLNALSQKGVHVVTVNDYLASRDADWMGQIYYFLGLSVGCIQHEAAFAYEADIEKIKRQKTEETEKADDSSTEGAGYEALVVADRQHLRPVSRKEAYACDITFGTNNEFGFDYLRDNMAQNQQDKVQRALHFAIIDEVDSILIDEARTPLIISAPVAEATKQYYQFAQLVATLKEDDDFNIDEKMHSATLTGEGITKIEKALGVENIYVAGGLRTVHHIEQALKARALFHKDKEYVVKDGEIIIIDEFTGRLMQGRRYSEGLHQAIEAKENVAIKQESKTLATITLQNYFRLYQKLSGMTGTAETEEEEFRKIYGLNVVVIPTHRETVRKDLTDRVYKNLEGKFQAVIAEVQALHEKGQPILLGTVSIEHNEMLSQLLTGAGIAHKVLNAKHHEQEAEIIAQAGKLKAVTVATNMAGRGVDIILGGNPVNIEEARQVIALGGLAVIGTERHEARRIDNQLRGRAGRQGDPGLSQFYVSMDDDLLRVFGSDRMKSIMNAMHVPDDVPIENRLVSRSIESAQTKVESRNFDIRKHLVEYDDVLNKQRDAIYRRRNEILQMTPEKIRQHMLELIDAEIEHVVAFHTNGEDEQNKPEWDIKKICDVMKTIFPLSESKCLTAMAELRGKGENKLGDVEARTKMIDYFEIAAHDAYQKMVEEITDKELIFQAEKALNLRSLDTLWIEHLDQMSFLRDSIGLRGYGQQDPLVEYKRESYQLFQALLSNISQQIVYNIFKLKDARMVLPETEEGERQYVAPQKEMEKQANQQAQKNQQTLASKKKDATGKKVGRNDPCPCGSGKKYKKCHGA